MRGVLLAIVAAAACGRVGFEPRPTGAITYNGDAIAVSGDGSVVGCGFVDCPSGYDACCTNAETSCVMSGTCTGALYVCGPCPKFTGCCSLGPDLGTICAGTCPAR
jgi:hypothetical protein